MARVDEQCTRHIPDHTDWIRCGETAIIHLELPTAKEYEFHYQLCREHAIKTKAHCEDRIKQLLADINDYENILEQLNAALSLSESKL